MARAPNYDHERRERDRRKAEKKAEKQAAKEAASAERRGLPADGDAPAEPTDEASGRA